MTKPQKFCLGQIVLISLLLTWALAFGEISNIQVSNLTSASATISWTTTDTTDGCVRYGLTTALGDTACDSRPDDDVHFVEISGLSTDTTYYFEVASGGEVDSNGGSYYTFRTTKVGIGIPYTIYGQVNPAEESAIVSVVVKDSLSGDLSYLLATLSDTSGMWFLNLGNLKDPTTNDVFSYSVGDSIFITGQAIADREFYDTTTVSGESPQDCGSIYVHCLPYGSDQQLPEEFLLLPNYPNPFNSATVIKYRLPTSCYVQLEIYNLVGQRVATLVDQRQPAGHHSVTWNASSLSSGIYFYRLQVGDSVQTRKMVVIK